MEKGGGFSPQMAEVADNRSVHPKAVMWNEEMEKSHC